jgi:hypothetical protein
MIEPYYAGMNKTRTILRKLAPGLKRRLSTCRLLRRRAQFSCLHRALADATAMSLL